MKKTSKLTSGKLIMDNKIVLNHIIYLMKRNLKGSLLFGLLAMVLLSSCDSNRYFEQNIEIPQEQWPIDETKEFMVDINDTTSLYNFYLNVRNTNDYPFANLYVFIETTFPNAEVAIDTVELQLANLDGKWLGSGYGKYKYHHFILRRAIRFVENGTYTFRIDQGMRKDPLEGISDIGIRLEYYP